MANNLGIEIQPSEDTKRKIATFAILSNQKVSEVVSQLEGLINETLTAKCVELLGGTTTPAVFQYNAVVNEDGRIEMQEAEEEIPENTPVVKTGEGKVKKAKSFADAHKATAAPPSVEEAFSSVEDQISGHELAHDRDEQNNKSLEEQVGENLDPEEEEQLRDTFSGRKIPNVGNNSEAYLDAVFGEPEENETGEIPTVTRGYAGSGQYGERPVKATKSFESRMNKGARARVSPHTGDED